jgi:hypoxanthine phosphoribosyltransferase
MAKATTGLRPLYKEILVDEERVDARIDEMAGTALERYDSGPRPLYICLLRGGAPFSAAFMRAITRRDPRAHPELDYMTVRTYDKGREPKPPEIVMDVSPSTTVEGRRAVLLDDVLDSGVTADATARHLLERGATGVDLVVLVQKLRDRVSYAAASLFGFELPDVWLTGMGLDDPQEGKEALRWAGYIAVANDPAAAAHAPPQPV